MSGVETKTMRDAFIKRVYRRMCEDDRIFFLSADFGAPALDKIRVDFKDRFINVGIAEQNLINVATGLALEGFTVYAYAIAPFLTMRAYEQIKINLALSAHHKEINVNLIGVGAGVSYDVAGPTHHCLEDITIIRALHNITLFSPSDWFMAEEFVDFSVSVKGPKYIRLDGKPLPRIYDGSGGFDWEKGVRELVGGDDVCIVSTGCMTHKALKTVEKFYAKNENIGVVDVFILKPVNEETLFGILRKYKYIITLEEAFINIGGLDSLVSNVLHRRNSDIKLRSLGFEDRYTFE